MGATLRKISKGILILFFAQLISSSIQASISITAHPVATLPGCLGESSGLDFNGGASFWSMNDSGDPKIFRVSTSGTLMQTTNITNANCRNWEDLTHDSARNYLFIGDIGNNNQDRTNLRIFKVPYPANASGTSSVSAQEIKFSYPDQARIPSSWMNFDSEAMIHYHDKIHIFTKADGSAIGYTKMYTIPDDPGTWVATLVDSFYTDDRTTSASISPNGTSVVLISNTHIHLFRNFTGRNFFNGQHTEFNISGGWTQKEAVSFTGNREIYLSDENTGNGNQLYLVDLSQWIPPTVPVVITTSIEDIANTSLASVYPNPANQVINVRPKNDFEGILNFSLYDITGRVVYEKRIENSSALFTIPADEFKTGIYFYKIYNDLRESQTERLIINH